MNGIRWTSRVAYLVIGLAALTVFQSTATYFAGPKPFFGVWEDSLMLARYAHNFFAFGAMEWNPGGQPTYGLTSPYYFLAVVLPVAKFLTAKPLAIPLVASVVSGVGFFVVMALTLRFLLPGPVVFRAVAMGLVAVALARNANDLSIHFVSGMDTFFALLYFTIFIALARWHAIRMRFDSALLAGLWGGLAFGVRPDLLAWTVVVPVLWVLLAQSRNERRLAVWMFAAAVAVVVAEVGFAFVYFHSPLPLPFYAKSMQLYPGLSGFRYVAFHNFVGFLLSYWLLFLLIALDIAVDARAWWRETSPLVKGLLCGTAIHMGYFLLIVTQIMPTAQRFYYPALPAVIFLAGLAAARLLERVPEQTMRSMAIWPRPFRLAAFAAALLVLPPHVGELSIFGKFARGNFALLDVVSEYRAYLENYWFGLDRFSTLPADVSLATTEVGHVGAMNLEKQVIDIAGLNDPLFVHHRFSATEFFEHYHPDLIYMPHPDYRAMNESLETDATFRRDYEWIPAEKLGAEVMGIALSRTSKHYLEMRRMVAEVCAEQRTGRCSGELR